MKGKPWTREEENVILNAVKDNPGCLTEAFEAASHIIERTPGSISNRWYREISKRTDRDSIALVCMSRKTYGINRKNCKISNEGYNINRFRQVWNYITNFFGV